MRRFAAALFVLFTITGCSLLPQTSRHQVRGSVPVTEPPQEKKITVQDLVGRTPERRARQTMLEHSSVEYFRDFTVGVLEIADDGTINPSQKDQVLAMLKKKIEPGGLLVVFAHGWHHGARTCDRDLCCFRTVLGTLKAARDRAYGDEVKGENVVGLYIGWRGESITTRGVNVGTIWDRKKTAETLGRSTAKELLLEINDHYWRPNREKLTMVSVGHSLGGALLFQAAKETLTGNVSDIENQNIANYRIARADCSREDALAAGRKAKRAGFGDLIVLVNPALEASEYGALDADLRDTSVENWSREQLVRNRLPYDKEQPYPDNQLPVLIAIASKADSAVGTIFPLSRVALAPRHPSYLRGIQRQGIGHYAPHVTHHLGYKDPLTEAEKKDRAPRQQARVDCDCSMETADVPVGGEGLDLAQLDRFQDFGRGEKYTLDLTPARRQRGWYPSSPYLVIEAEPKIMAEHSDIFNPIFVGFLTHFMDAYYTKFEALQAERRLDCE